MLRRPMAWFWQLPLALGAVYGVVLALLWVGQEKLIFLPQKLPQDHRFDFGPDVHEAWIERDDGVRLHALHLKRPAPDGVVFYLHGNAGNLEGWFSNADFWRQANLDLFMLDYRGYGKSGGRVQSQEQLLADVRAAWQALQREGGQRYAGKKRIVLGRSLGSALAAKLAVEVKPDLVVLVSPYESLEALAAEHYAWVPRALLRYPLRTDQAVAQLTSPLVLVHGERDEIIPIGHSERLLAGAAAASQARLVRVRGAGHNDLQLFAQYLQSLRAALASPRP